ncbi:hypothetical protein [Paracoccus sp. S-4012]|uniref:rhodanese-like domain-containing protein n=1 Tax=Paracoccus sp. S-4012 TaxID=2665648 RepID=UPI001E63FAD2|nr:hypothetical protein [Paracoccus sp. S-4012]
MKTLLPTPRLLPGAIRADDRALAGVPARPSGSSVVLCRAGHRRSQGAAAWMRAEGRAAEYLDGGFQAWQGAGLPLINPVSLCFVSDTRISRPAPLSRGSADPASRPGFPTLAEATRTWARIALRSF